MTARRRILVVDDERAIRRLLRTALAAEGYDVIEAESGVSGLATAAREQPDLMVLDLGLPDIDGQEVIRRLREWSTIPLVVLTVRAGEEEKIAALDAGADDYVTKPFGMGELLARLRTAQRHRLQASGDTPVFRAGPVEVDLVRRLVRLDGQEIRLSPREYDLLALLIRNAGRVLTHRTLLETIWGKAHVDDTQYLRVYVGQLRQKLGDTALPPKLIVTEPGVGYRLIADDVP